ncbi:MAG: endonuclease/exonuclease/phosphatase family protein, partial [Myxococcales bacterium]|nr:endonuclease/exonuclease/phosphatase family protein [Myxococcales bacterium]
GVDAAPADAEPPLPVRLRIVAANLTSGSGQAYEAPGIRILDGLDPDVALVQEFNAGSNTAADLRGFVDAAFGPGFGFARESGVQLPNGVVSRYPIRGSGTWDDPQVSNRGFTWARIDVPGPRDLWAVSIHLLTSSATNRDAEAQALAAYVAANVPPGDLLVIGGDLNTAARTEAAITTLGGVVDTAGPHPRDQAGNEFTNAGRTKPYDWVMPDADLAPYVVTVDIGAASFADGLVFDTRVFTPLDDVAPALVTDSAAPSMQHMAVVKDFVITE